MELSDFLNKTWPVKNSKTLKVPVIQTPIALDIDEEDDDRIDETGKEDHGHEDNVNDDDGNNERTD